MTGEDRWPWPAGSATGVGSLPGQDIREATRLVLGELPDLPHLPELPSRGPGADMLGRTASLLTDLHVDLQPAGWRLVERAGVDERRAASYLGRDLDALEEMAQGWSGALKLQVAGPWSLAAGLELPRGDKALGDPGARRDLVESLADGVAEHVAEVRKRAPGAAVVLQLDEPSLPAVLAGHLPTASGFDVLGAIEPATAEAGLRAVAQQAGVPVLVHCCARGAPLDLIRCAGAIGISLDLALLGEGDDEALGTAVEAGVALFLGVVPGWDAPSSDAGRSPGADLSDPAATVERVRRVWRRLGFAPERLPAAVVVSPACGLAGASPSYARAAMAHCREAARQLLDNPEG